MQLNKNKKGRKYFLEPLKLKGREEIRAVQRFNNSIAAT